MVGFLEVESGPRQLPGGEGGVLLPVIPDSLDIGVRGLGVGGLTSNQANISLNSPFPITAVKVKVHPVHNRVSTCLSLPTPVHLFVPSHTAGRFIQLLGKNSGCPSTLQILGDNKDAHTDHRHGLVPLKLDKVTDSCRQETQKQQDAERWGHL